MKEHESTALRRAWQLMQMDPVIIDTETTGIKEDAQIIELSAVDTHGNVIIDTLIKPTVAITPEAQRVHCITDEMLKNAPLMAEAASELRHRLHERELAAYNADFDGRMILQSVAHEVTRINFPIPNIFTRIHCVMKIYARYLGNWDAYHNNFRYASLDQALRNAGKTPEGNLHRALTDAGGQPPPGPDRRQRRHGDPEVPRQPGRKLPRGPGGKQPAKAMSAFPQI